MGEQPKKRPHRPRPDIELPEPKSETLIIAQEEVNRRQAEARDLAQNVLNLTDAVISPKLFGPFKSILGPLLAIKDGLGFGLVLNDLLSNDLNFGHILTLWLAAVTITTPDGKQWRVDAAAIKSSLESVAPQITLYDYSSKDRPTRSHISLRFLLELSLKS